MSLVCRSTGRPGRRMLLAATSQAGRGGGCRPGRGGGCRPGTPHRGVHCGGISVQKAARASRREGEASAKTPGTRRSQRGRQHRRARRVQSALVCKVGALKGVRNGRGGDGDGGKVGGAGAVETSGADERWAGRLTLRAAEGGRRVSVQRRVRVRVEACLAPPSPCGRAGERRFCG